MFSHCFLELVDVLYRGVQENSCLANCFLSNELFYEPQISPNFHFPDLLFPPPRGDEGEQDMEGKLLDYNLSNVCGVPLPQGRFVGTRG